MRLSRLCESIAPYTAGEQPKDRRYIKLNTNENPFAPSAHVKKALEEDVSSLRLYPDPECRDLREAIASVRGVKAENVYVGNGSDEVLALSFPTLFTPGQGKVYFADVTYSFYPVYCAFFGVDYETVPLNGAFEIIAEDYCNLPDAQGIILANPNAPTGRVLALSEIEKILRANPNIPVIVDEAYVDFCGVSCVPLIEKFDNLIVVQTFSKSYALAGIRCGYAIANAHTIEGYFKIKDSFNSYPVSKLTQKMATAAVLDKAYYGAAANEVMETRDSFAKRLEESGFEVLPSGSNFVFARSEKISGLKLYQMLKERGILVRNFQKPRIADFVRITVGTKEQMEVCFNTILEIVKK